MFLRRKALRKLIGVSGAAALTVGLVLGQGLSSPAGADELIQDPGFESTVAGDSPGWTEADSLFGSPICDASCGFDFAHAGSWWAWFGGSATAGHTGSVSQTLNIPVGANSLTYWYFFPGGTAPFDATLTVKVDGTTVKTHTEVLDAMADYEQQTVDITTFADGGSHTLSFNYLNGAAGLTAMMVDDVSIQFTPPDTTAPNTTASGPAGGVSKSLTLPITFTSNETPSTFNCKVDTGAAAACSSPKTITVTPGQHTFSVAATDAAGNTDTTPATVSFTAYDCPTLDAAVAKATKSVSKAKKALKKAKKSGDAKKIAKAKKKLKKAKKKLKEAKGAAAPCGSTPKVTADASIARQ